MRGLVNLGNTCYINTLIQCLGHVESIREWLLDQKTSGEFSKELADIYRKMWVDQQSLMPRRFVHYIGEKFALEKGQQHDLNELLLLFIDRLSTEDDTVVDILAHAAPTNRGDSLNALYNKASQAWSAYHKKGFSKWDQMTEGLWVSQVQCKHCNTYMHNFEPFTTLDLDLVESNESTTLQDALHTHFVCETLTEWKCDKCNRVAPTQKVLRIWKLPRVLTVVWKRFGFCPKINNYRKIATPVSLPKELHFPNEYVLAQPGPSYHLKSIGLHHGGMHYGHYTCMAQVTDGKWVHYDDTNMRSVDASGPNIDIKEAYIAMYEMT